MPSRLVSEVQLQAPPWYDLDRAFALLRNPGDDVMYDFAQAISEEGGSFRQPHVAGCRHLQPAVLGRTVPARCGPSARKGGGRKLQRGIFGRRASGFGPLCFTGFTIPAAPHGVGASCLAAAQSSQAGAGKAMLPVLSSFRSHSWSPHCGTVRVLCKAAQDRLSDAVPLIAQAVLGGHAPSACATVLPGVAGQGRKSWLLTAVNR